jgi:hypothetical protein
MRRITISIALALVLGSGAAVAQGGGGGSSGASGGASSSASGAGTPSTTGQGGGEFRAPIGRVQPRPSDFPPGYLDNATTQTPSQRDLDRKLQICRGC